MVDRVVESSEDTGTPSDDQTALISRIEGTDEQDSPFTDPSSPQTAAGADHSPTTNTPHEAPTTATDPSARRRSTSTHSSSPASVGSDLELNEMRRDDPLYAPVNGRVSEDRLKVESAKRSWTDMFDREEPDPNEDHDHKEARRLGRQQFFHKTLINAILIALWYLLSISMSVYNKWMFSPGNLDFHYPLFTTSAHMIVQWILASLVLFFFPFLRPQHGTITENDTERNPRRPSPPADPKKPLMTPWFYLTRIVSCATVTGLDIGLGNTSLKFISLTFFTMCKSSTLGFVLLFAILFRLEAPSIKIFSIIAVMTIGVILMVAGETAFSGIGFVLLMLASFFSGLRWSLTQILLRRTPATSNPFSTLFFLTPVMFVVLFILAVPVEGFPALKKGLDALAEQRGLGLGICIILFPGCIAFCMTSAEFALLKRTSVVTLSVCGIFKEVLTITAAGFIFGDELTPINVSGVMITIAAIAVYNVTRMRRMRNDEMTKAQERWDEAHSPMLDREGNLVGSVPGPRPHREGAEPSSNHTRVSSATGLTPNGLLNAPAALMKVKRRGEYEELIQDERDR